MSMFTQRYLPSLVALLMLFTTNAYAQTEGETEQRLAELEDRVDQVEKRAFLDRFTLRGDYRTIFNSIYYSGPTFAPGDSDPTNPAVGRSISRTSSEIWSHRLRIGFLGEPTSSLRVTARMVLYKIFGDGDQAPFINDSYTTRVPRDSTARFDQAWVDWFATDWLAFSAGRIAYTEGNPHELRDNSTIRGATWGLHMVDGEYDTLNVTIGLNKLFKDSYLRFFYASWFNDNDDNLFGDSGFLKGKIDNLRIIGGNLDLSIPGLGKNFVQLGYYNVPRFRPFFLPIPDPAFDASSDPTNTPPPLNGSLLFPSNMPDSMGSYQNISALIELYDIGGIGLDLFAAAAIGFLKPNGRGIEYLLPSNPADPASARAPLPFLFLASQGDNGKTFFGYAGLRYALPFWTEPKLGFEYNYGSRYHISFNVQTDNLLNKLALRGQAFETYIILPVNEHAFFRATYLHMQRDYDGSFFGPNPAIFGSTAPTVDATTDSLNVVFHVSL